MGHIWCLLHDLKHYIKLQIGQKVDAVVSTLFYYNVKYYVLHIPYSVLCIKLYRLFSVKVGLNANSTA